ncbi:transposase [Streptomyces sp. Inha503]|uniref:transposase n=1 Tax=Streptomyces sp. Inha503 TaxID=3383314 RepID=UPI0039A2565E
MIPWHVHRYPRAHPYAPLLASLPRIGKVNLGQIIGEIGPILERVESCEQFIAETGVAPVTRASGKSHAVRLTQELMRPDPAGELARQKPSMTAFA